MYTAMAIRLPKARTTPLSSATATKSAATPSPSVPGIRKKPRTASSSAGMMSVRQSGRLAIRRLKTGPLSPRMMMVLTRLSIVIALRKIHLRHLIQQTMSHKAQNGIPSPTRKIRGARILRRPALLQRQLLPVHSVATFSSVVNLRLVLETRRLRRTLQIPQLTRSQ